MNELTVAHITIQQDEHGRYSLNDLHRAAGGSQKHRPNYWLSNKQAKALIEELISERQKAGIPAFAMGGIPPISATQNVGTVVVKELVYAYAMWISPAFTLKVIRAYDSMMHGETATEKRKNLAAWRAHLKKFPQDGEIKSMAEKGEPYWYIARRVKLAVGTVGKRIKRMIEWGFMDADHLRIVRIGARPWWEHRRKHFNQLSFW